MYSTLIAGLTGGVMVGFIFKYILNKSLNKDPPASENPLPEHLLLSNEGPVYELALVVNHELKMTAGKIVAQCSHAALGIYDKYSTDNLYNFEIWEKKGKPITIYKVSDTDTLVSLQRAAKMKNLMTFLVRDAGRTQIACGSCTVLAIGPDDHEKIQNIVGYLPLH